MASRCWLVRSDGLRIRVDRRGLLIGRGAGSDVLVPDGRTSSSHALVWQGPRGPQLVAFGRNETRLNGTVAEGVVRLAHDDLLEVPGETLRVVVEGDPQAETYAWVVAVSEQHPYALYRTGRAAGGGPADELHVPDWPPRALVLSPFEGSLAVQFEVEARCNGERVEAGEVRRARIGDAITIGGTTLRVLHLVDATGKSTHLTPPEAPLTRVGFSFLPHGGELRLGWSGAEQRIRLPEIRARFVATLLTTHGEYRPGDWLPDDVLISNVWPRETGKGRVDVNILLHRVRRDLITTGVDAFALIERDTGATRFLLGPGVDLEVS